jgi:transposase InsO family protein
MNEKMFFIAALLEECETMSELCRQFGISRKTGYKWNERYSLEGAVGLKERSRRPHTHPGVIGDEIGKAVLAVRRRHSTWAPRKVKAWLEAHDSGRCWPAASTIGTLFDTAGLTRPRKLRKRTAAYSHPFASCREPNDVWCVDFKGWFKTGDGSHVEPLTISDGASRYLICCEAVERSDEAHVWPRFEAAFRQYGLPLAVRSDNGAPFASRAVAGLSRLSVKLLKAGIMPERIEPGKPQQNGRHERMHLTLKQDTASPPASSLGEQIKRFERFRRIYNHERPHEALGQRPPASHYCPSPRHYDGTLRSPDYPCEAVIRKVRYNGAIKWKGQFVFVSEVLSGEPIGLTEIGDDVWLVKYGPFVLGTLRGRAGMAKITPAPLTKRAPRPQPT